MAQSYRITERCTGQFFDCDPGQSILKAMEQRGLKCVPVGCRGGGCGFCKVAVISGTYECGKMSKVHVPPECRERGELLACRVYPRSDLTIECRPSAATEQTNKQTTTTALR